MTLAIPLCLGQRNGLDLSRCTPCLLEQDNAQSSGDLHPLPNGAVIIGPPPLLPEVSLVAAASIASTTDHACLGVLE